MCKISEGINDLVSGISDLWSDFNILQTGQKRLEERGTKLETCSGDSSEALDLAAAALTKAKVRIVAFCNIKFSDDCIERT